MCVCVGGGVWANVYVCGGCVGGVWVSVHGGGGGVWESVCVSG